MFDRRIHCLAIPQASLAAVLLIGCAESHGIEHPRSKTVDWVIGDAADAGFDTAALEQLSLDIQAGKFPNTHALLIEHDGSLVFERYFSGTDESFGESIGKRVMRKDSLHDLRSITKSVTSALVGIALQDDFEKAVERPIAEYLPDLELEPAHRKITLHHVLTMTPGLEWNEMSVPYTDRNNDAISLYRLSDPTPYVLSRPIVHEPGSAWYYIGGCAQVLADVILQRTGQTIDDFAEKHLFDPLGITNYQWLGPRFREWTTGNPSAMAGLRLTARDLAKIGSVYAHGGRWQGRQVVPEAWVTRSSVRYVKEMGEWSGGGIWGYGYMWKVGELPSGETVVAGAGNGNQRLFVLPHERLVVTVYAGQYNLPFKPHSEMLLNRVLEAYD